MHKIWLTLGKSIQAVKKDTCTFIWDLRVVKLELTGMLVV